MHSTWRSLRSWYRIAVRKPFLSAKTPSLFRNTFLMSRYKPLDLFGLNFRFLWVQFKTKKLNLELAEKLRILQANFEKDPKNVTAVYQYFRELNRIGMYQTVVRLYHKSEYGDSEKIRMQYDYAVDHLEQMRGILNSNQNIEDKSQYTTLPKYLFKKVFQLLWRWCGLFVFVFIITMLIK